MLRRAGALALVLTLAAGCGRTLYHYHRTVIGVDIAGNVTGNMPSGHLTLGYARRLVVVQPKQVREAMQAASAAPKDAPPPGAAGPRSEKLVATVFCTQVRASLGGLNAFREILATGPPAEQYATSLVAASDGLEDWQYRNYVCPGFEIPKPLPTLGSDGGPAAPGKILQNNAGITAPVGALPRP